LDTITGTGYVTTQTPQSLELSSGSTTIWILDGGSVRYWEDTLVDTAVSVTGPATDTLVSMNAITGLPNNVTLTWTRASLATSYDVQVSQDSGFVEKVVDATAYGSGGPNQVLIVGPNQTSGSAGAVTLTPGQTYYWRVRADQPITGAWSEARSFTIQPGQASVPTIGSPANGSDDIGENPAFSWTPVAGASMYEFQLAVGTNFRSPLYSESLALTGIRPAIKLDAGTTYFWRVRATEPVMSDWSTIANFTVAVEAEAPPPPVEVVTTPPPVIQIPAAPPAQEIVIPPPEPPAQIAPAYIWAIIIIGAILVIVVIVLIVRTRRTV
jgi:hypothetical protein